KTSTHADVRPHRPLDDETPTSRALGLEAFDHSAQSLIGQTVVRLTPQTAARNDRPKRNEQAQLVISQCGKYVACAVYLGRNSTGHRFDVKCRQLLRHVDASAVKDRGYWPEGGLKRTDRSSDSFSV